MIPSFCAGGFAPSVCAVAPAAPRRPPRPNPPAPQAVADALRKAVENSGSSRRSSAAIPRFAPPAIAAIAPTANPPAQNCPARNAPTPASGRCEPSTARKALCSSPVSAKRPASARLFAGPSPPRVKSSAPTAPAARRRGWAPERPRWFPWLVRPGWRLWWKDT